MSRSILSPCHLVTLSPIYMQLNSAILRCGSGGQVHGGAQAMEQGYYGSPTIHDDTVVFVCEGDLWSVPASGGVARRLTSNPGEISTPMFSPDGTLIAFAGRDEGAPEVYVMPAKGGPGRRRTFLGANSTVVGWSRDGATIIFASNAAQPFPHIRQLYSVGWRGGEPQ